MGGPMIPFRQDDGGRSAAGYKGKAGDCVCRSIAIAARLPYNEVYETLAEGNQTQRKSRHSTKRDHHRTAREGIFVQRKWFKDYMFSLGFTWTPTMGIGTGCKVHLRQGELPPGRLVVSLSGHYCAVIDGVVHDTYLEDRGGTRCVYGYWKLTPQEDQSDG